MGRVIVLVLIAAVLAAAPPWLPLDGGGFTAMADDDDDGGNGGDDGGGDDDDGDDDGGDDDGGDDDGDNGDDDDTGADDRDSDDDDDRGGREARGRDDNRRSGRSGTVGERLIRDLGALFGAGSGDRTEAVPLEIIATGLDAAGLRRLEAQGFRSLSQTRLGALDVTLHRIAVPAALGEAAALDAARQLVPAARFDRNHLYRGSGEAGCTAGACWPVALVEAAPLPPGACARGASVAIIDTGVDTRHSALRAATIESRRFLAPDVPPAPPGHGTAIAALLVGERAAGAGGLTPGATLLAAEAVGLRDGEPLADAAAILAALDWALTRRARVIGLSLAGPENTLLERGVQVAARRANLVAAAGNGGANAGPAYPAAYPEVMAVGAIDARRRAWRGANRGDYVELVAPGVDVVSARAGGGFDSYTGTSFAVPFAMAAVLRARAAAGGDPGAARRAVTMRAIDLGAPGRDPVFGHGLVRAEGTRCS